MALAHAADIAVPASSYYPKYVPPAIYDWTGIYVGGHIGGGMLVDSPAQTGISTGGFGLASVGKFAAGRRDRWRPDRKPNYEFAPWVVGVEASWTASAISRS